MCRPAAWHTSSCEYRLRRSCASQCAGSVSANGTHVDQPDDVGDPREPAEDVVGLVDRGRGACLGGDVGRDRVSVDLGGDAPRPVGVEVGDGDTRTGSGEQHRGQASAAVAAADDERGLVLEAEDFLHRFPSWSRGRRRSAEMTSWSPPARGDGAGTGRARVADTIVIEDPARGVRLEVLAEG